MKHKKHAKLTKPNLGNFGRNEWSIIGTTCSDIKQLSQKIIVGIPELKMAYLDASHDANKSQQTFPFINYSDEKGTNQFSTTADLNKWQLRPYFNEADFLLINGNHFQGKRQIVVIDSKKEISLSKKLDRLTDVGLVLLKDRDKAYDFLVEQIVDVPILNFEDINGIIDFLRKQTQKPELYGLLLMGGKSIRMGHDKGLINYHGKPQREYAAELLSAVTTKTFLSCRMDQVGSINSANELLPDTFLGLGPYGGMLSAFQKYPNKAWLVMAVDLPKMDASGIQELVEARDISKIATAFLSPDGQFPEPLITIWEPKSYAILLQFLAQGFSCPRKVLINSDVKIITPKHPEKLMNVNSPSDLKNFQT